MQMKTKIVNCHTADSKPVKQEVNSTVILSSLVFPDRGHSIHIERANMHFHCIEGTRLVDMGLTSAESLTAHNIFISTMKIL
jgi:hypothetical protein